MLGRITKSYPTQNSQYAYIAKPGQNKCIDTNFKLEFYSLTKCQNKTEINKGRGERARWIRAGGGWVLA